jgi:hypothetical protein
VSTERDGRAGNELKEHLRSTPECISMSTLDGPLTDDQRRHFDRCARCQTELALLEEFRASAPSNDEGAAVHWIAAEVRRRRHAAGVGAPRGPGILAALRWRPVGIAAAALLAVVVGFVAWDFEPRLRETPTKTEGYRSEQLKVLAPVGDVATPPDELTWVEVRGATRYDVVILEVDRTALWHTTSSVSRAKVPASVVSRFAVGKTVIWEVRALNQSGTEIASSGAQRFRVIKSP